MRMIVKKAVSSRTSTNELMMLSQWISKEEGKKAESSYLIVMLLLLCYCHGGY